MLNLTDLLRPGLLFVAVLALAACSGSGNKQTQQPKKTIATADHSTAVAKINGEAITKNELRAYLKRRTGGQVPKLSDQDRKELLGQLVSIELLAQHAKKQGLDQKPEIAADLNVEKAGLLANDFIRQYLDQHPVDKKQIKAAYQAHVQHMGKTEYKARHILLPSKAKARAVIAKLDKGAKFADLAKKESTGPSAKNGGELGWFNPSQMVPAFSQAVEHLKKGQYTHAPVKTRFGWHVILLQDIRKTPAPSFASMKDQLKTALQRQQVETLIGKLKDNSKVNIDQKALKAAMPITSSVSPSSSVSTPATGAKAPASKPTQQGQNSSSGAK
jgi:peptidyl-prolyl cis-trans isomerase C